MGERPDAKKAAQAKASGASGPAEAGAEPRDRAGGRSTVRTDVGGARKRVTKQTPTRGLATAETVDFGRIAHEVIDPRALVGAKQPDAGPMTEDYGRVIARLPADHDDAQALRAMVPTARPDPLPVAIDERHQTSSTEDFGPVAVMRNLPAEPIVLPPTAVHETPQEWNAGPRTEDLGPPVEPAPAPLGAPVVPRPASTVTAAPAWTTPAPPTAPAPTFPAVNPFTPPAPAPTSETLEDDRPSWIGIAIVAVVVGVVIWAMLTP